MAYANPHITSAAIEATEFMDLSRRFRVTGVPKTIVNETVEIMGALPEEMFVRAALQIPPARTRDADRRAAYGVRTTRVLPNSRHWPSLPLTRSTISIEPSGIQPVRRLTDFRLRRAPVATTMRRPSRCASMGRIIPLLSNQVPR